MTDVAPETELCPDVAVFYERRALKQQAAQDSSSSTRTRIQALTEQFKAMQVSAVVFQLCRCFLAQQHCLI
jgi:hypothetical protein